MAEPQPAVTELLLDWSKGREAARDELMPLIYNELRRLAGARLRDERADHTLQATAIVNEAYLRLVDQSRVQWRNRAHFFAIAARMIRRILVDHARRRRAGKRGGGNPRVTLDEGLVASAEPGVDVTALDDALRELEELDPTLARLVDLRFFGGLTIPETAEALAISPATVKREWTVARTWLHRRIGDGAS